MAHDPTYPDVKDMPNDVLASAIVLADMLIRSGKADNQVKARREEMSQEWDRREERT